MPDVFSDILCLHDSKHYPVALVTVLSSCCKMVFAHLKQQPCRMGVAQFYLLVQAVVHTQNKFSLEVGSVEENIACKCRKEDRDSQGI